MFVGVLVNACLAPVHVCAHKTSKMVQKRFSDAKTKETTQNRLQAWGLATKIGLLVVGQSDWYKFFAGVLVNISLAPVHVCVHKTSKMVQKTFRMSKQKKKSIEFNYFEHIIGEWYQKIDFVAVCRTFLGQKVLSKQKQRSNTHTIRHKKCF